MRRILPLIVAVALLAEPARANELTHLINKLKESAAKQKDAPILQQDAGAQSEDDAAADAQPGFRAPGGAAPQYGFDSPRTIALILPTDAGGLLGRAASAFNVGCSQSTIDNAARFLLYATDGKAQSAVDAYRAAVDNGADIVVGPALRGSVKMLLANVEDAPVPTLLLQPGEGANYFYLTMEAGREAAELAELMRLADVEDVLVVLQESDVGARQLQALDGRWRELTGRAAGVFRVVNAEADWQRLFEQLKEEAEEGKRTVVFAAGDADFVRRARHFTPSRNPVFAGSFSYGKEAGASAAFTDNLYVMEMPALLSPPDAQAARDIPALVRRFEALGADACGVAVNASLWDEGWDYQGKSGDLLLIRGEFRRRGVLARYRNGKLEVSRAKFAPPPPPATSPPSP